MSNELDKHFGEQLHAYESVVDAEAIWDAVRPATRRRRRWPWFLLFLGIISVAGAVWWIGSSTETYTIAEPSSKGEKVIIQPPSNLNKKVMEDEPFTQNHQEKDHNIISEPRLPETETRHNTAQETASTSFPARQEIVASTNNANAAPTPVVTDNLQTKRNQELASIQSSPGTATKQAETATPKMASIASAKNPVHSLTTAPKATAKPPILTPEVEIPIKAYSQLAKDTAAYEAIAYRLPTKASIIEYETQPEVGILTPENHPTHNRHLSPWSMQLDGSYLNLQRTLLAKDTMVNLIAGRLATESVLEAWSTDMTLAYNWHPNWQLRTGIGYTQINIGFALNNTEIRIDSVDGLQAIIVNPDNSVDSIFGKIAQTETTLRERQIFNSFRQWEVPILVNYETRLGQLSLIAAFGIRLRLNRTWEGQVFTTDVDVSPWEEQDWYRSGLGVQLQGGLHLGYNISPQLQLRAGAGLRYALQNFTRAEVPFQERYQLSGVQLGLRYQFYSSTR